MDSLTMGQSDILLSDSGEREVDRAVHKLRGFPVDAMVSGPLKRCVQTASPFRAVGCCGFIVDPGGRSAPRVSTKAG